jgi:regulator of sigma E protease
MILFFLIEILIKKPISIRKRELAQKVGFFLLILLMAIVFYNDLIRIVTNH